MKPSVNIPREKLAELLQASGSTLTPEQYTASLPPTQEFSKYPSRARAAAWSKNIFIVILALSAVFTVFDFEIENVIVIIGLGAVTYFEIRVHRYFMEDNTAAPTLGFRNQSGFAVGILIYGLYHSLVPEHVPQEYQDLIDPATLGLVESITRFGYVIIGVVGGISQFALAWYYRGAGGGADTGTLPSP